MTKYKYPIVVAILVLFIVLMAVFSEKKDDLTNYVSETITEALTDEGISYKDSNYSNESNENTVKIYLFRGHGCSHCYEFLEFVNDELIKKYKNKVSFVIYETWNNKDNNALMKKVSKFLGDNATGVPYIIVGDKTWIGYAEEFADEIKNKIDEEYAKDKTERYDVLVEMNKAE